MKIGELSRRTGVPARMLRYYEEQDLLHPERSGNGYRTYSESAVYRVQQIRGLLDSGLTTEIIRTILPYLNSPDDIHVHPDCLTRRPRGCCCARRTGSSSASTAWPATGTPSAPTWPPSSWGQRLARTHAIRRSLSTPLRPVPAGPAPRQPAAASRAARARDVRRSRRAAHSAGLTRAGLTRAGLTPAGLRGP